jgi:hypothetical protein
MHGLMRIKSNFNYTIEVCKTGPLILIFSLLNNSYAIKIRVDWIPK